MIDQYLRENLWLDWDIEHTYHGRVDLPEINQIVTLYFSKRQERGFQSPGIFALYVFDEDQITNLEAVIRQYPGGSVVPIFNGYGGNSPNPVLDKIERARRVLGLFGEGYYGIMEFETRWGDRYDQISVHDYLQAFPDALIVVSQ